jgi:hypothetical protein
MDEGLIADRELRTSQYQPDTLCRHALLGKQT